VSQCLESSPKVNHKRNDHDGEKNEGTNRRMCKEREIHQTHITKEHIMHMKNKEAIRIAWHK
jgi:hypothetical protein